MSNTTIEVSNIPESVLQDPAKLAKIEEFFSSLSNPTTTTNVKKRKTPQQRKSSAAAAPSQRVVLVEESQNGDDSDSVDDSDNEEGVFFVEEQDENNKSKKRRRRSHRRKRPCYSPGLIFPSKTFSQEIKDIVLFKYNDLIRKKGSVATRNSTEVSGIKMNGTSSRLLQQFVEQMASNCVHQSHKLMTATSSRSYLDNTDLQLFLDVISNLQHDPCFALGAFNYNVMEKSQQQP